MQCRLTYIRPFSISRVVEKYRHFQAVSATVLWLPIRAAQLNADDYQLHASCQPMSLCTLTSRSSSYNTHTSCMHGTLSIDAYMMWDQKRVFSFICVLPILIRFFSPCRNHLSFKNILQHLYELRIITLIWHLWCQLSRVLLKDDRQALVNTYGPWTRLHGSVGPFT